MSGEAVIDHLTGLVWQRDLSLFASAHTQGDASTTCLGATFAGMHGWRLPTAAELLTLQDSAQVPAFPLGHPFLNDPGIVGDTFWTSSAVPGTGDGYAVYFHSLPLPHSGVMASAPGNLWMAWCVRGPE